MRANIQSKTAFTLIELLVVISIISLLISILLPALAAARKASQQTLCSARLQQIGLATNMYANDNRQYPPNWLRAYGPTDPNYPNAAHQWATRLAKLDYLPADAANSNPKNPALLCPSSPIRYNGAVTFSRGHYAINSLIAGQHNQIANPAIFEAGTRLDDLKHAGKKILYLDAGIYLMNWFYLVNPVAALTDVNPANYYVPGADANIPKNWTTQVVGDALGGRHPNRRVNIQWADGHGTTVDVRPLEAAVNALDRSAWTPN